VLNPVVGLVGSKNELFAPNVDGAMYGRLSARSMNPRIDAVLVFAVLLIVAWAFGALVLDGPGWLHGLLTVGVFLSIYRIVVRGTPNTGKRS
jgi:uncharacterized membrane protein